MFRVWGSVWVWGLVWALAPSKARPRPRCQVDAHVAELVAVNFLQQKSKAWADGERWFL